MYEVEIDTSAAVSYTVVKPVIVMVDVLMLYLTQSKTAQSLIETNRYTSTFPT